MLNILISLFLLGVQPQVDVPVEYTMETALEVINSITEDMGVEDIDEDLIIYLGSDQFDVRLASILVFGEANLEPELGQQLVMHTLLNRVKFGYWGDTIERVIYSPSQFCATNLSSWGTYTGINMRNVLLALYKQKFNLADADTLSILYFNNESVNDELYAKKYKLNIIQKVGGHTFFARKGE